MIDLKKKLSILPHVSGIYKFLDIKKNILYIGKANDLFNRVNSYFSKELYDRPRIVSMIPLISNLEIIQTENEIEALVLESALIKKYQPKFNTDLKDDKSYAFLYINTKDKYPLVKIVRSVSEDELKKGKIFGPYPSGRAIKRVYRYLRKIFPFCLKGDPNIPCFDSHIGLCPGPVSVSEYRKNIDGIISFLNGHKRNIITDLQTQMNEYSNTQEYEKAAQLRDKIEDLKYLSSKIRIGYKETEDQYIENRKNRLIIEISKLAKELDIPNASRIECYDISNTQGKLAYGSMSVALNGEISSNNYRIFKIKQTDTPNDYIMLREVLERRINDIQTAKDSSLSKSPDIILIDGGLGQINAVFDLIPKNIFLLGITKGRKYKRKGSRLLDEFWITNGVEGKKLKLRYQRILITLRDEAHRFAIIHHRKLRVKEQKVSQLDGIVGLGKVSRKKLLTNFKNIENIKKASTEELNSVLKNKKISETVFNYFNITKD